MRNVRCFDVLGSLAVATVLIGTAAADGDDSRTVYSSIPSPLPPNVVSEGAEAYAFAEIGDAIVFPAGTGGVLTKIKVIMSSWACVIGNWYTYGSCSTPPRSTFMQPVTLNIYSVDDANPAQPKAGTKLATVTQTFQIPYRPSSDTVHCPSGEQWYDPRTKQCNRGLAAPIAFDLSYQHLTLPGQVLIGVAYDTTHYGPHPIGATAACYHTTQGCPYDSLNVSTDGTVFFGAFPPGATSGGTPNASSVIDPNGVFFNYYVNTGCGTAKPGVFEDDTLPNNGEPKTETCFTGYHPQIRIWARCGTDGLALCPPVIGRHNDDDDES